MVILGISQVHPVTYRCCPPQPVMHYPSYGASPSQQSALELAEFCLAARLCPGRQEPVWNEFAVSSQERNGQTCM